MILSSSYFLSFLVKCYQRLDCILARVPHMECCLLLIASHWEALHVWIFTFSDVKIYQCVQVKSLSLFLEFPINLSTNGLAAIDYLCIYPLFPLVFENDNLLTLPFLPLSLTVIHLFKKNKTMFLPLTIWLAWNMSTKKGRINTRVFFYIYQCSKLWISTVANSRNIQVFWTSVWTCRFLCMWYASITSITILSGVQLSHIWTVGVLQVDTYFILQRLH